MSSDLPVITSIQTNNKYKDTPPPGDIPGNRLYFSTASAAWVDLHNLYEHYKSSYENMDAQSVAWEREKSALNKTNEGLQAQIGELNDENSALKQAKVKLETEVNTLKPLVEGYRKKEDVYTKAIQERAAIAEKEKNWSSKETELRNEKREAENRADKERDQNTGLQEQLREFTGMNATEVAGVQEMKTKITELQAENKRLSDSLKQGIASATQVIQKRLDDAIAEKKALEAEVQQKIKAATDAIQTQLSEAKQEGQKLQAKFTEALTNNATSTEKLKGLADLESFKEQASDLFQENTKLTAELAQAKQSNSDMNTLTKENQDLKNEVVSLQGALSAMTHMKTALQFMTGNTQGAKPVKPSIALNNGEFKNNEKVRVKSFPKQEIVVLKGDFKGKAVTDTLTVGKFKAGDFKISFKNGSENTIKLEDGDSLEKVIEKIQNAGLPLEVSANGDTSIELKAKDSGVSFGLKPGADHEVLQNITREVTPGSNKVIIMKNAFCQTGLEGRFDSSAYWTKCFDGINVDWSKPQTLKVNNQEISRKISTRKGQTSVDDALRVIASDIKNKVGGDCKVEVKSTQEGDIYKQYLQITSSEPLEFKFPEENSLLRPEMVHYEESDVCAKVEINGQEHHSATDCFSCCGVDFRILQVDTNAWDANDPGHVAPIGDVST